MCECVNTWAQHGRQQSRLTHECVWGFLTTHGAALGLSLPVVYLPVPFPASVHAAAFCAAAKYIAHVTPGFSFVWSRCALVQRCQGCLWELALCPESALKLTYGAPLPWYLLALCPWAKKRPQTDFAARIPCAKVDVLFTSVAIRVVLRRLWGRL